MSFEEIPKIPEPPVNIGGSNYTERVNQGFAKADEHFAEVAETLDGKASLTGGPDANFAQAPQVDGQGMDERYARTIATATADADADVAALIDVAGADGVRTIIYTAPTGTITLPPLGNPGQRVRVGKANETQGFVNIVGHNGEQITRDASVEVRLNQDGDYWELQDWGTRWELLDGRETGNNFNGRWRFEADGTATLRINAMNVAGAPAAWSLPRMIESASNATYSGAWCNRADQGVWVAFGNAGSNSVEYTAFSNSGILNIQGLVSLACIARWYQ